MLWKRPMIGKINAVATYFAWLGMAGLLSLGLLAGLAIAVNGWVVFALVVLFVVSAVVHLVLALLVRCPFCARCLTIQIGFTVHPDSIDKSWSSVVYNWFSGEVGCIHCGRTVSTRKL